MALGKISTSSSKYVVLDVETNGIKSKEDDLLSISFFKPDEGKSYNRFLPLDLNVDVVTSEINGITAHDLAGREHLKQVEIDRLFSEFDLENRTILHYGSLDPRFIRDYFARHGLKGFDKLHFYNFKHLICSSGYSDGTLTKDNLCRFFGVKGVNDIHNGKNDCLLEWELFKKLDGRYLLARLVYRGEHRGMWRLAVLNPGYILPVSYLSTYSNLSRIIERPYICCTSEIVYQLEVSGEHIVRFQTNFSGLTVEHLINTMLNVRKYDDKGFLANNSSKNELLGYMPSATRFEPMKFNEDGTVTARYQEDKEREKEINAVVEQMREGIVPLVKFIKESVFGNGLITSQELVVDNDLGILALCDLSTDDAVLEIKTSECDAERYAEQLHYEARGRDSYLLGMNWIWGRVIFTIRRINTFVGIKPDKRRNKALATIGSFLDREGIEVIDYASSKDPIKVRCRCCRYEWNESYARIRQGKCICPRCYPERAPRRYLKDRAPKEKKTPEQMQAIRAMRFSDKVYSASSGRLEVVDGTYKNAREKVLVRCATCGHVWSARPDHVLDRTVCPKCGRRLR